MNKTTKPAFSLLELLIVVVVITILAAILIPTLKYAKERVKAVKCATQMHALYSAWDARFSDNKTILGNSGTNTVTSIAVEHGWPMAYIPYLPQQNTNLLVCPADNNPASAIAGGWTKSNITNLLMNGVYAFEEAMPFPPYPRPNPYTTRLSDHNSGWQDVQVEHFTNKTVKLTVTAIGNYGWAVSPAKYLATDATLTNLLQVFHNSGDTVTLPTIAVSYGYNAVNRYGLTNTTCNGTWSQCGTGGKIGIRRDEEKKMRAVLLVDYPLPYVNCSLCYAMKKGFVGGTYDVVDCGPGGTQPPGPCDNWDVMGPLIGRHNGFCNVLFQDGGMAAYRPSEIDPRTNMWQVMQTPNGPITNRLWRTLPIEFSWGE